MDNGKIFTARIKRFFSIRDPGLITGASDDPSGIATYSQAGAKFGLSTPWTALVSFPLMVAIQEMCARIGVVTSTGLTTSLKKHYSKFLLYLMMVFSIPAIILNIGADIASIGAVVHLIIPSISPMVFSIVLYCITLQSNRFQTMYSPVHSLARSTRSCS